jgi:nucleoside-diphosphate-sugar epimerase
VVRIAVTDAAGMLGSAVTTRLAAGGTAARVFF